MRNKILSCAVATIIGIFNANAETGQENKMNDKTLVVYFSVSENTKKLAETIHQQVGGDIVRIEPTIEYPTEYNALADFAKNERDQDMRPVYKDLGVNISDYDTVFVGYPIWWYTLPMIMYTFFDNNDFSGKTVIPFNTHEGSSDGGTYDTIKSWAANATVLDGLPIRGGDMVNDQSDVVKTWLNNIGK